MKYTKEEILSKVDHTLLKPEATWPQIQALCDDAIKYHTASVCINTCYVKQAVQYMAGRVAVCCVVECPASVRCQFSTDFWSVGTFPEQEGTMGLLIRAEHPALKDYPTGTASNWQWWTQSHGRAFRLPRTIEPVVRVLDSVTRLDNLGLLWEARLGKGRLLVSGMDLAGHLEFPECRYLLECLAAYLDGPAAPMAAVTPEELRRLIRVSPR